ERRRRREAEADVAELRGLDEGVVVRADEKADVDGVRQRNVLDLMRDERVAEARDGHQVRPVTTLELDDGVGVRQRERRLCLLRLGAPRPPELERREAIAVERR